MFKDIQGFAITQLYWIMNLKCSQLTLLVVDLHPITKYIPFRTKTQFTIRMALKTTIIYAGIDCNTI